MAAGRKVADLCTAFGDPIARRDGDLPISPPEPITEARLGRTRHSIALPTP